MVGEDASAREVPCTEEMVPLEKTLPDERERNPKPSELIVFTRRNPKRSSRVAVSDLNIDRLTRIHNRGTKSRKDKEIFDPAFLVGLIRDPNLTTKKRKPLKRRVGDSVWGEIKNLSKILDLRVECCKLKQGKEVTEKKNQIALGEKMDGNNKISNQFVKDVRHLKQEEIFNRDLDSTFTVQRDTNQRETTGPGSSPDSVIDNPVPCEANPVVLQHKQSTRAERREKRERMLRPVKEVGFMMLLSVQIKKHLTCSKLKTQGQFLMEKKKRRLGI